jgi:hypothetical protein
VISGDGDAGGDDHNYEAESPTVFNSLLTSFQFFAHEMDILGLEARGRLGWKSFFASVPLCGCLGLASLKPFLRLGNDAKTIAHLHKALHVRQQSGRP